MRASPQGGCYSKPVARSIIFQKPLHTRVTARGMLFESFFHIPDKHRCGWFGPAGMNGRGECKFFSVISVQVIPAALKVRTDHGLCIHGCRFASPSYLQPLRRGRLSLRVQINPSPFPLIAHFHENGADQAPTGRFVRETCDHACSVRLISQMRRSRPFVVRIKIR